MVKPSAFLRVAGQNEWRGGFDVVLLESGTDSVELVMLLKSPATTFTSNMNYSPVLFLPSLCGCKTAL
jgi:hypothetical protein